MNSPSEPSRHPTLRTYPTLPPCHHRTEPSPSATPAPTGDAPEQRLWSLTEPEPVADARDVETSPGVANQW